MRQDKRNPYEDIWYPASSSFASDAALETEAQEAHLLRSLHSPLSSQCGHPRTQRRLASSGERVLMDERHLFWVVPQMKQKTGCQAVHEVFQVEGQLQSIF